MACFSRARSAATIPEGALVEVDLAEAALRATEIQDERVLADLRREVDEELEHSVRSSDYRDRAIAYRAIGQLRFAQKVDLLRRGLEDESPACRGSALLSLELMSRDHPRVVNSERPLLHSIANDDPNGAVQRLAVLCLRNGSSSSDTITLLDHIANSEDEEPELRAAAGSVRDSLKRKATKKHSR